MKRLALTLLTWTLPRILNISRTLWADLEARVRMADNARAADDRPLTSDEKHADVDQWLSTMEPFSRMPILRQYIIQAAVLSLRLRGYWQSLDF